MITKQDLEQIGIVNAGEVYYNSSYDELHEAELKSGLKETDNGTIMVDTGIFTGRSPKDKYFVDQDPSNKYIAWGDINFKTTKEVFDDLFEKAKNQLSNKDIYVQDVFCGASEASKKSD